jgi:MFS family permease
MTDGEWAVIEPLLRRKVLMAGLTLFGIASVVASQVTTAGELIAVRAVMGAGGAVIMPMGLAIIPVLFPEEAGRRRAVTVTTIGLLDSMPLGPLLGGWLIRHFAWGWVFLINARSVSALSASDIWALGFLKPPHVPDDALERTQVAGDHDTDAEGPPRPHLLPQRPRRC